ncbi:peptide ABC transporter [Bacillus pseudomycoides]|uniref:cyclic peptide export ABC transporter n=1 Tax=Bacillus pseudomycoides TaxID=64104 RepID=UPI000BF1D9FC|nr:cyclic peptide export ABC transporter [Bacillus pseudomycoides]PEJ27552.1 peptide ABC transporter [Bacillus pseudomycoides]PHG28074.1 peptide ABC transporter [Bacillus pseudomycoides]
MKLLIKFCLSLILVLSLSLVCTSSLLSVVHANTSASNKIEEIVEKKIKEVPGLGVVIVKGNQVIYKKGFGYADLESKKLVNSETLFELGSTSKAFTALGILDLEQKGILKLDDPVNKYLPWFQMNYKGEKVVIKIKDLVHHTSGIPFSSINDIPVSNDIDALNKAVGSLVGKELRSQPGEQFHYATINYDVLGLIIEKVTGKSFEEYMSEHILKPLGLSTMYLERENLLNTEKMAKGYKYGFNTFKVYEAPSYRGNTPAGYYISDLNGLSEWLKIQLNSKEISLSYKEMIEKSHAPNLTVDPIGNSFYAMGWDVYKGGQELSHEGSNPNFSSFMLLRPNEEVGIAVVSNINSVIPQQLAEEIRNYIIGGDTKTYLTNSNKKIDRSATIFIFAITPFILVLFYFNALTIVEIIRGKRKLSGMRVRDISSLLISVLVLLIFYVSIYYAPKVFLQGLSWGFLKVWGPSTVYFAALLLIVFTTSLFLYLSLTHIFQKDKERSYAMFFTLSSLSGFGNAMLIYIINEAFNRQTNSKLSNLETSQLVGYFLLGIIIYILGQKIVRSKLITITNHIVYEKRLALINRALNTSYSQLESLENGSLEATLNNDTEKISSITNILVTGVTGIFTLIFCFIYLASLNILGFIATLVIFLVAVGLYYYVGQRANVLWEQTRDIQNIFFSYISDLLNGSKELFLNQRRRSEFEKDIQESCKDYRDKRIGGDIHFANVFVIGELLFVIVIGVVTFAFPVFFKEIQTSTLRTYVFVLLYMTGPINLVLDSIPRVIQTKISWNRFKQMYEELNTVPSPVNKRNTNCFESLKVLDIEYAYSAGKAEENQKTFAVGPISYEFKASEIIFITGGNGSGKSTLAKLLTGLYSPSSGTIFINDQEVESSELRAYYSAIFSDFHLFEKLYGVDYTEKELLANHYLETLNLNEKVEIMENRFSTIKLSTGQRKRLALLVSYLEDRPILLFDEWAADQDPEYRKFFYEDLLPKLKESGKCVIAITHDDAYFGCADKVIKLELGKVAEKENIPAF